MRLCPVLLAAAVLGVPATAQASLIKYTWSGTFEPLSGDPWGIAPRASFDVRLTLAADAPDLSAATAEGRFSVSEARFVIDGVATSTISPGEIRFWNNASVDGDTMTYFAEIELAGVRSVLGSYVTMPDHTFAFGSSRARPPVWGRTTVYRSGYASAGGSPYQSEIPQGSAVTAVPEPAGTILWTLVGLAAGRIARRRSTTGLSGRRRRGSGSAGAHDGGRP